MKSTSNVAIKSHSVSTLKRKCSKTVMDPDLGMPIKNIKIDSIHLEPGEKYCCMLTKGHSMTDRTKKQIVDGSLVVCREIDFNIPENQIVHFISKLERVPLKKPVIILGYGPTGDMFNILKTVYFIDRFNYKMLLRSYNHSFADYWVSFEYIKRIFEVELVRLPEGREFVPQVWENSCDVHGIPILD